MKHRASYVILMCVLVGGILFLGYGVSWAGCTSNEECDDSDICTDDVCIVDVGCENTFDPTNDPSCEEVECTVDADCDDGLFCNGAEACVDNECQAGTPPDCGDGIACTVDSCDEGTDSCVNTPDDALCDDSNVCTDDACVVGIGCEYTPDPSNDPSCQITEACRTPGFWGEHSCPQTINGATGAIDSESCEKNTSQNITQAVIGAGGGCLTICGEAIANTSVDSAASALEAMCVNIEGESAFQLVRQLTATALNCVMSGDTSGTCSGISIESVFEACNTACASSSFPAAGFCSDNGAPCTSSDLSACDYPSTAECIELTLNGCIKRLDCYNNGGVYALGQCWYRECFPPGSSGGRILCRRDSDCTTGTCRRLVDSCYKQKLCNENIGLCFEDKANHIKPGPAGSPKACKMATKNNCDVIIHEGQCTSNVPDICP